MSERNAPASITFARVFVPGNVLTEISRPEQKAEHDWEQLRAGRTLNGLTHVVQYRRKDQAEGFDHWHTMAAFDCEGAASVYHSKQGNETWEYRWIKIPANAGEE